MTGSDSTLVPDYVARHHVSNLVAEYVDAADRCDIDAAVGLLGLATVRFPGGMGFSTPEDAAPFFARLWPVPIAHRHDVSLVHVDVGGAPHFWTARAHYTRWILDPEPILHTLGEYAWVIDDRTWTITSMAVTRTWSAPPGSPPPPRPGPPPHTPPPPGRGQPPHMGPPPAPPW